VSSEYEGLSFVLSVQSGHELPSLFSEVVPYPLELLDRLDTGLNVQFVHGLSLRPFRRDAILAQVEPVV
jgi:hypothetical protein